MYWRGRGNIQIGGNCTQVLVDRTQHPPFLHPTPLFSFFFFFHFHATCPQIPVQLHKYPHKQHMYRKT